MGDEKVALYASGGSSYFHPGSGVVLPWDPYAGEDHRLTDINLYFVDSTLARWADELFRWMVDNE
eukprot:8765023-Lingulodinium_polyedra.AAC.1